MAAEVGDVLEAEVTSIENRALLAAAVIGAPI